jgi:hypothetical protein
VIFIDLENKLPTDADLPPDIRWSQADWDAWLAKSTSLLSELSKLHANNKTAERNELIDKHSAHWGKIKPWLLTLSHGKCWFSDVRELYSHYDVEHFRPKKEAKALNGSIRDGYWWLAFDYMNFRVCGNVGNRKKGGWFPLRYGSPCSSFVRRCEGDEIPHFLDPTNAHDVTLLAFDEEGKAVPAPGISRWDNIRVLRTVERLKLTEHHALAEERRGVWQQVTKLINKYELALTEIRHSAAARERVKATAREITELTKSSAELSAVAKWCVLLRNEPRLLRLLG